MPRFSIIITCYNQRDLIREAIDSALAQTSGTREIIVVDDGSTDGSAEVLGKYGDAITLKLLGANEGAPRARNIGGAIAQGDYLVFLDGDDRLLPKALDVYAQVAELGAPTMILAKMHFFQGSLSEVAPAGRPVEAVEYEDYFRRDRSYRASASAMVIERRAFQLVGGWTADAFPADDQDLLLKLGCAGRTIQILSPATAAYRLHEGNATRSALPLIRSCHLMVGKEKAGDYPGGRQRRFDRRALLGGFVLFLVKRAWRSRLPGESLKLLAAGWMMGAAAVMRRGKAIVSGRSSVKTLPRQ